MLQRKVKAAYCNHRFCYQSLNVITLKGPIHKRLLGEIIAYYPMVNVITFSQAKSDHIKRLLQYLK